MNLPLPDYTRPSESLSSRNRVVENSRRITRFQAKKFILRGIQKMMFNTRDADASTTRKKGYATTSYRPTGGRKSREKSQGRWSHKNG